MVNWSRVADLAQRTIVWSMVGLTAYATVIFTKGAYGVVSRYRQRKRLEKAGGNEEVSGWWES